MAPVKAWCYVVGVCLALFFSGQLRQELDPYSGLWTVDRATQNGALLPAERLFRVFLKISPRRNASVAEYWTCGVPSETFAAGKMELSGDKILLYKESWATKEREPMPSGELLDLPDGKIGFLLADPSGDIWFE